MIPLLDHQFLTAAATAGERAFHDSFLGTLLPGQPGIFQTIPIDQAYNVLEDVDYDALHGVSVAEGAALAGFYVDIAGGTPARPLSVLEIGCGTGFLTVGLAGQPSVRSCISLDIASGFLAITRDRLRALGLEEKVALACADLARLEFRPGCFDAILGNSILHHILDYEALLAALGQLLRPGGRLVMSEPCQQGKSYVSFFIAAMLKADAQAASPLFDTSERHRLEAVLIIHRREIEAAANPGIRATWEDKHIFDTGHLAQLAPRLGFSRFLSVNTGLVTDGFREEVAKVMHIMGVDKPLDRYGWLFEAFQEEYMAFFAERVETPHQVLILER